MPAKFGADLWGDKLRQSSIDDKCNSLEHPYMSQTDERNGIATLAQQMQDAP